VPDRLLIFTLSPAWFQTAWIRVLAVACGALMAWLLHRFRVGRIVARMNERFADRLAERNRIAEELCDRLLQGFLSASIQVHVARDRLPEDSPIKATLTHSLELMSEVIEEGRNALHRTVSTRAFSLDLENAFAQIPQEFRHGDNHKAVEFRLIVEGRKKTLNPLLRDEIYRIGLEALTHTFRYSRANHVEIDLHYGPRQFRVLVRDDGCGFDPHLLASDRDGHSELSAMRARADRIGARLRVYSSPKAGTELSLSVPGSVVYQD
jgi:signal transduction histidine kinase